ncbi:MAG: glycosyltransferase family A protein [bacterium]|nr:glycosyltransferase family A protein [bacterium]
MISFSVVIPLYNKAPSIEKTMDSILNQRFPPTEIIIVDDGSTDGGLEIVRSMSDARLKILETDHPRSGPSIARNIGIRAARSLWIALLDADDHWDEDYLHSAQAVLSESQGDICCVMTAWRIEDGQNSKISKIGRLYREKTQLDFKAFLLRWLSSSECPMWTSAVILSRAHMLQCGGFPEHVRRGEDKVAWFRIMQTGEGLYNPSPLATYAMGVAGQETTKFSNTLHPLCHEISQFESSAGVDATLLERLYNLQIIRYFKDIAFREKMSAAAIAGFHVRHDPFYYGAIQLSRNLPLGLLHCVAKILRKPR